MCRRSFSFLREVRRSSGLRLRCSFHVNRNGARQRRSIAKVRPSPAIRAACRRKAAGSRCAVTPCRSAADPGVATGTKHSYRYRLVGGNIPVAQPTIGFLTPAERLSSRCDATRVRVRCTYGGESQVVRYDRWNKPFREIARADAELTIAVKAPTHRAPIADPDATRLRQASADIEEGVSSTD